MWRKMPRIRPGDLGGMSNYADHAGGMVYRCNFGLVVETDEAEQGKAWQEYDAGVVPQAVSNEDPEASKTPAAVVEKDV